MTEQKKILTNLGYGVVGEYSKLGAKLKLFFQIPTLEQLKVFKIDYFNDDSCSNFTSRIKGKKITSKTHKIFLENLLKDFTKKEPRKISNFEDEPFSYIETWFFEDGLDEFLNDYKDSRLVLYDTFKEIYPSKKIDFVHFNADVYLDHLGCEYCPLGLILYVNGWSTDLHKEDKDLFVKWEFSFNKKVNDLMESLFCRGVDSIIDIHQHYREDFIHMMRSPFNLDEYVLHYPHDFHEIFEKKLNPNKIIRKEPLNNIPDTYSEQDLKYPIFDRWNQTERLNMSREQEELKQEAQKRKISVTDLLLDRQRVKREKSIKRKHKKLSQSKNYLNQGKLFD